MEELADEVMLIIIFAGLGKSNLGLCMTAKNILLYLNHSLYVHVFIFLHVLIMCVCMCGLWMYLIDYFCTSMSACVFWIFGQLHACISDVEML